MFVYAYQLTFFIACIVLDEGRIEQKRRDCCVCLTVQTNKEDEVYLEESPANESSELAIENKRQELYESWMRTYARFLLLPWVKAVVIAGFLAFGGLCAWSTSKLSQEFSFTEVVPSDSYLIETADVIEDYGGQTIFAPYIYFRNVDQGNSTVQEQMIDYVNEFVSMDAVSKPPDFFWLLDFRDFVNSTGIEDQPFESQMDAFLADENYYDLYREVIERDDSGDVKVSRVHVRMLNVDEKDIHREFPSAVCWLHVRRLAVLTSSLPCFSRQSKLMSFSNSARSARTPLPILAKVNLLFSATKNHTTFGNFTRLRWTS
mmetsp:Transcript_21964/g.47446  ORF Transcript_21964/g.47446 Transcript_21964/m.47446 type:complete len:317 (-) Transcript_21964:632-1582(-)